MSTKTPAKNTYATEINLATTPVILPQSPSATSPQSNLTGLPRVAKDIAADVYNNIQKWNDCHIRGAKLLQQIVLISDSKKEHPTDLEPLIDNLHYVVQQLTTHLNALVFLSTQIKALVKLHKNTQPLFISLSSGQLSDLICDISSAYNAEFKVKEYVLENVAHSASQSEAMFHAACWAHQQNISNNINLKLETLLTETGHRKIN